MKGGRLMTDPDETSIKTERDAAKFEQLLKQLDRMGRDKTPPNGETEKDVDGHS
jgi:hypothetical protein